MNDYGDYLDMLFEKHFERLFKYCLAALHADHQDATDVVGDVFLAAEKNVEKLFSHPDVDGWLYKTANHLISKKLRDHSRRKARIVSFEALFSEDEKNIHGFSFDNYDFIFKENDLSDDSIDQLKQEILSELNHMELELYNSVFVNSMSCLELAKEYGISQDAVRMRVHRLKMKLHRLIQKRFY